MCTLRGPMFKPKQVGFIYFCVYPFDVFPKDIRFVKTRIQLRIYQSPPPPRTQLIGPTVWLYQLYPVVLTNKPPVVSWFSRCAKNRWAKETAPWQWRGHLFGDISPTNYRKSSLNYGPLHGVPTPNFENTGKNIKSHLLLGKVTCFFQRRQW